MQPLQGSGIVQPVRKRSDLPRGRCVPRQGTRSSQEGGGCNDAKREHEEIDRAAGAAPHIGLGRLCQCAVVLDLSIGRLKLKVTPRDTLRTAPIRPACASMMDRQIASPMPIPVFFVVKNGSKIFSKSSCPGP